VSLSASAAVSTSVVWRFSDRIFGITNVGGAVRREIRTDDERAQGMFDGGAQANLKYNIPCDIPAG
jgi:hypothetical protein